MKDTRVFFNPIRMISPKLDSEAIKLEELLAKSDDHPFTLEEGLVIMLSKLIVMTEQIRNHFMDAAPGKSEECEKLGNEVHILEKKLTENLACALTDPPHACRAIVLFPGHLERVGDFLESILNCCKIKARNDVQFTEKSLLDIDHMLKRSIDLMTNFRDSLIRPNRYLLQHVVEEATKLDQLCQDWELAHVERLLDGSTAPKASSLYLDILESTQSLNRHIRVMAENLLSLVEPV
jgi:Na+/phosphate symporter